MKLKETIRVISKLVKIGLEDDEIERAILKARRYQALQTNQCNRGLTPKEEAEATNISRWFKSSPEMVRNGLEIQDDPRGACVRVTGITIHL